MNVLHVNFATIIRIIKEQALQEKEPRKSKTIAYMEKEENFFKTMVDTIRQLQTRQTKNEGSATSMES